MSTTSQVSPSVPPPLHTRRSSGFLHTLKRGILGGEKDDDSEFTNAVGDFSVFQQLIARLHDHAIDYRSHLKGVLANSTAIATDFYDLLNDVPKPHPYMSVLTSLKKNHENLNTQGSESEIFQHYNEVFIKVLVEEKESMAALEKRIVLRNSLRKDYLYYKKKYDKLQAENEKAKANPQKEISVKDTERLGRNSQKLAEISDNYIQTNRLVLDELNLKWKGRLQKYGPLLNEYLNIERIFVTKYAQAIENLISNEKVASFQHSRSGQTLDPAIIRVSKLQAEDERRGNVTPVEVSLRRASRSENSQLDPQQQRGRAYSENTNESVPQSGAHLNVQPNNGYNSRRATPPVPLFNNNTSSSNPFAATPAPAAIATSAGATGYAVPPVTSTTPTYNPAPYVVRKTSHSATPSDTNPGEGGEGDTYDAAEGRSNYSSPAPSYPPPTAAVTMFPPTNHSLPSYANPVPAPIYPSATPTANPFVVSIASAPSPSYNQQQAKTSNPFDDD